MSGFVSKSERDGNMAIAMPQRLLRFKAAQKKLQKKMKEFIQQKEFYEDYVRKHQDPNEEEKEDMQEV